jgi:DNA invertase Pin-like site-specific DNA recombinase
MPGKTIAYSYIRFSSPEQAKGDSLRRQTELAATYCKRRSWKLDDTLTLRDLGVPAFRGQNALVGNLRTFLNAIDRGTVRRGSALIVESIDRISRQGIDEGYDLCKKILKAGVLLVTLSPEREFGAEAVKSLSKGALEIQLILERAAEESERKSERLQASWVKKRREAWGGGVMTHSLPAWVEERGGRLELIPAKAATVKHIFDLAIAGYGAAGIVKKLTQTGVPPIAKVGYWARSYVAKILKDRRAVGEYQPRTRLNEPDGEPIPGYYPAVVTEDEFSLTRAASLRRWRKPGRIGRYVNVWAGLLFSARAGDGYYAEYRRQDDGRPYRILINREAKEGRGRAWAFPFDTFEFAVLDRLQEIDPHDILNGDATPDESLALAAELARVETRMADLERELLQGDVSALARVLRVLEAQKRDLAEQLADARQRAAHPLSETWGEAKGLVDVIRTAPDPDEARMRLRDALRSILAEAWLLVIPRGKDRLGALQLFFNTDKAGKRRRRDYLIFHRATRAGRGDWREEGGWRCKSLASVAQIGELDLRKREHARELEELLATLDPVALWAALEPDDQAD